MKKLMIAALAMMLGLTVVGCDSKEEDKVTAEDLNKTAIEELDKQESWSYTVVESSEQSLSSSKDMLKSRNIETSSLKSETVYAIAKGNDIYTLTIFEVSDEKELKAYEEFLSSEDSEAYVCSKGDFVVVAKDEAATEVDDIAKKLCE